MNRKTGRSSPRKCFPSPTQSTWSALPRGWFSRLRSYTIREKQFSIQIAERQRKQGFRALEARFRPARCALQFTEGVRECNGRIHSVPSVVAEFVMGLGHRGPQAGSHFSMAASSLSPRCVKNIFQADAERRIVPELSSLTIQRNPEPRQAGR